MSSWVARAAILGARDAALAGTNGRDSRWLGFMWERASFFVAPKASKEGLMGWASEGTFALGVVGDPLKQHGQVGILGFFGGVFVGLPRALTRVFLAARNGQIEEDEAVGLGAQQIHEVDIAALNHPAIMLLDKGLHLFAGLNNGAALRGLGVQPGQGVEVEVAAAIGADQIEGQGGLARA